MKPTVPTAASRHARVNMQAQPDHCWNSGPDAPLFVFSVRVQSVSRKPSYFPSLCRATRASFIPPSVFVSPLSGGLAISLGHYLLPRSLMHFPSCSITAVCVSSCAFPFLCVGPDGWATQTANESEWGMWEGGGQGYIIDAGGWSPSSLELLDAA